MNLKRNRQACLILAAPLLALSVQAGIAQEAPAPEDGKSSSYYPRFGGPDSVQGQLAEDARIRESWTGISPLEGYFGWKDRVREEFGFSYTLDYTAGILSPTDTLSGEDIFSSGAVRFYGSWDLLGRDSGNTGSFIWKVEHRHRYADSPVSAAASDTGYAGAILGPLSNAGTRLTNLYWKQNLDGGRVEIVAGMLDATDWLDLYALASPWTGFSNLAFATGSASIALPDDATLGAYVNAMITDHVYISGGLVDANADSTDPFNGFDTFFNDNEYFKSIEIGRTTSRERFYLDNTHLSFWHVDERERAGVSDGWGANFSFAHAFDDRWMPFLRAGYADDGGSLLQKSVSTGLGYQLKDKKSLLGFGVNWGEPNEDTFGPGLDDQVAVELFSRLQMTRNLELTPSLQWINNPALNPAEDQSWIFGLRARMFF